MSYVKHNFQSGEILTANALNEMDNQIAENSVGRVLLWENADPSAAFAPQTVSVDTTGYDELEIVCNFDRGQYLVSYVNRVVPIANRNCSTFVPFAGGTIAARYVNVTNSGVQFFVGRYNNADNNNYCVPAAVYGIKY